MTDQIELENKKKFALAYLKTPTDSYAAAIAVFGNDISSALKASVQWPRDEFVQSAMAEAVQVVGDLAFLPSKADLARAIWNTAETSLSIEDKLKAYRLYADVRGFIEKQNNTIINNNSQVNNQVMLVRDHGPQENWENKLAAQQLKLVEDASARQH